MHERSPDLSYRPLPQEVVETRVPRFEIFHPRIRDLVRNLVDEVLNKLAVNIISVTVQEVDEEEVKVEFMNGVIVTDAFEKQVLQPDGAIFQCQEIGLNKRFALVGGLGNLGRNIVKPLNEDGEGLDKVGVKMIVGADYFRFFWVG